MAFHQNIFLEIEITYRINRESLLKKAEGVREMPLSEEDTNAVVHSMSLKDLHQKYTIKKKIMENSLYSVYIISAEEAATAMDEVLLLEHPPAQKPFAHRLAIENLGVSTATELMKKIVDAVGLHFERNK